MALIFDVLAIGDVFEYADTGELYVLQGDPENAVTVKVTDTRDMERGVNEGVLCFDHDDLEAVGIRVVVNPEHQV